MKFLVEEQGKFKEFLSLHFYKIFPKSEEKGEQIFPKNGQKLSHKNAIKLQD